MKASITLALPAAKGLPSLRVWLWYSTCFENTETVTPEWCGDLATFDVTVTHEGTFTLQVFDLTGALLVTTNLCVTLPNGY